MLLKIIEVVVLLLAGILFVTWQFRDLRRAKEITRQQREAEKNKTMHQTAKPADVPSATTPPSDHQ